MMQLSDKDKKQILEGFIDIFARISNQEYQKKIWIKGEGPEVDSFDDTVCDFFGECDAILEKYKNFGITDKQYQLLRKFRKAFEAFADENDWPPFFIESPEWKKITEMAKDVLAAFNYERKGV